MTDRHYRHRDEAADREETDQLVGALLLRAGTEALEEAERTDPELYLFLRLEATTGLWPGEVHAMYAR